MAERNKLSIIIPVYNSHRVLRRQILYWQQLGIPESVEIIIMDDGSDPPLNFPKTRLKNFNIYPTGDTRPWTQPCAKNMGAELAKGEYLFFTDIDHIITPESFNEALNFRGDRLQFTRKYGILNRSGKIVTDPNILFTYGMGKRRYRRRGRRVYHHVNTFVIRKKIFHELGGFPSRLCKLGRHNIYDDNHFWHRYRKHHEAGKCKKVDWGSDVLVFPGTIEDPQKLFHNLPREKKGKGSV